MKGNLWKNKEIYLLIFSYPGQNIKKKNLEVNTQHKSIFL